MLEDWKSKKLGEITTLNYGKALTASNRVEGDVPVYSSAGITGWHDEALVDSEGIVIGRKGTVGSVYYSKEPFFCIDTAYYIKPDEDSYDLEFLYYKLISMNLPKFSGDSAVPGLNREIAYGQEILLPEIEEQRRIAEILSALDEKIELNLEMNQTLERIAQATFKHWFVDFQFPGFDGELVDGLPKGWRTEKISNVTSNIQYGFTQSSSSDPAGYKFLRITDIQGGTVNWSQVPYCIASEKEFEKYKIVDHDIFIARTGASTGENVYVTDSPEAVFASYLIRVQFENPHLALYIGKFLRRVEYFGYVASIMGGSAQPNANAQELTGIEIVVPTDDILEKYFAVVNDLNKRKIANEQQNQTLTQIRDNLLPKLMSGKIRVAE